MADNLLIDAYLAALAERLPADSVDELADGLVETYERMVGAGLAPDRAAAAAIAEFGAPAQVTAAFALHSPGRRIAVRLLATAPMIAAIWGSALVTTQVWNWPVPPVAAVIFGIALGAVAGTFLMIAFSDDPRRNRLAVPASSVLMLLDLGMITTLLLAAPAMTWPVALAVPASLLRIALTARAMPRPALR